MTDKKTTKKPGELAEEILDQISGGPNLSFIKILGVKDLKDLPERQPSHLKSK